MKSAASLALFGLALGIAISVPLAYGQRPAPQPAPGPTPSPGGNTGTAPGSIGRPGIPGGNQGQSQPDFGQQQNTMAQPIFLSGRVVMDDGTAPPEPVVIERVCNGRPRPEGYTDSKGRFSFQLGQNIGGMISDASMSDSDFGSPRSGMSRGGTSTPTERDLNGCEIRASLAGFRSDLVNLAGRRRMDNPELGTIVLHRMGNVEGTTISATSVMAPKDARKAFEKGSDYLKKKKYEDAQKQLEKAVELYPKYAAAWYALGMSHQQRHDAAGAREAYQKALAADSRYLNPYLQLASLSMLEKNWQDAADTSERLIRLDPVDYPGAYFMSAVANLNLAMAGGTMDPGKLGAAEKSARDGLKADPEHRLPSMDHVLGIILANKRDYTGAAEHLKSYLEHAPDASDSEQTRKQLSEVQKFAGSGTAAQQQ